MISIFSFSSSVTAPGSASAVASSLDSLDWSSARSLLAFSSSDSRAEVSAVTVAVSVVSEKSEDVSVLVPSDTIAELSPV